METDNVKETVTNWFNRLVADFFNEGVVNLVSHLEKCLNLNRDYVEK